METRVYCFADALYIIDDRISADMVSIKTVTGEHQHTFWLHPTRWDEIGVTYPDILARVSRAPEAAHILARARLVAMWKRAGRRPLIADDFARNVAERVSHVQPDYRR